MGHQASVNRRGVCGGDGKERERMSRKEALYALMWMWKDLQDTLSMKSKVCRKTGMRPFG